MTKKTTSFGNVLKKIRKERQLTQKMLAQDICSQSVLSRIENDEELPNVLVMQQLCQRLGVTIDYVLALHSQEVTKIHQNLERMGQYFYHKQYEELYQLLKGEGLLEQLYIETDLQLYFYYLGSCEYFLNGPGEKAIDYLKQGLSYTINGEKTYYSSMEIQLISCIGRVYDDLGQKKIGQEYLERSIDLMNGLPKERVNYFLVKVFFNYARFLHKNQQKDEALKIADIGLKMVHDQNSYYYLEELYTLIGQIHADNDNDLLAKKFQAAALAVKEIKQMLSA